METISEIKDQFLDNVASINVFISCSQNAALALLRTPSEKIESYGKILEKVDMLDSLFTYPPEVEESQQGIIEEIRNLLEHEYEKLIEYFEKYPFVEPSKDFAFSRIVQDEDLVEFVCSCNSEETLEDRYRWLNTFNVNSFKNFILSSAPFDKRKDLSQFSEDDFQLLLNYCKSEIVNQCNLKKQELIYPLTTRITMCDSINARCRTNIYSQEFIVIMSLFDATIFDITEKIISNHFFDFCKAAGAVNGSYKLKDIIEKGSFDCFQEDVINDILKKNHLRALLKMLHDYRKDYFFLDEEDCFKKINEFIARRNLFVHKNGIVDKEYFEQAGGNPYCFRPGDIAYINGSYYTEVTNTLSLFVDKIIYVEIGKDDTFGWSEGPMG